MHGPVFQLLYPIVLPLSLYLLYRFFMLYYLKFTLKTYSTECYMYFTSILLYGRYRYSISFINLISCSLYKLYNISILVSTSTFNFVLYSFYYLLLVSKLMHIMWWKNYGCFQTSYQTKHYCTFYNYLNLKSTFERIGG